MNAPVMSQIGRLQAKTGQFLHACFPDVALNRTERGLRVLEETLELAQVLGVPKDQALRLVDYVYARPAGELDQELGGVALTLGAAALAAEMDLGRCWETEVDRVLGRIEQVRSKHRYKQSQGIVAGGTDPFVLDEAWLRALIERLEQAGFAQGDIRWSENLQPPATAEAFAREAIFVICNSGLNNKVAHGIFLRVMGALHGGHAVDRVFGHRIKVEAIERIWRDRQGLFAEYHQADDKLAYCRSLPCIGPVTCYHLAKNLGLDVAKPDRHLVRLAQVSGESAQALCERLAQAVCLRVATVDLLLWRACAEGIVDPHTGQVHP